MSLFLLLLSSGAQARTTPWKPERVLGSAGLELAEIGLIYLPPEPDERLKAAVKDLSDLWPGALDVRGPSTNPAKQSLVMTRDPGVNGLLLRRERTRIDLRAADDEALADGLYAICRELLGARWFWGGELGFEQVGEIADKFPERIWREQPAFVQRTLYPVATDFGRRNGLNRKYSFNHNLARIFNKEVYEASPEAFAEIGGKRTEPKGSAGTDPQPDFTDPATIRIAANAVRRHFEENPQANSFSLSINDNSLFDESAATEAIISGDRRLEIGDGRQEAGDGSGAVGSVEYFRGRPNYTNLVFGFMNEVATRVFDPRDDRFLIADSGERATPPSATSRSPLTERLQGKLRRHRLLKTDHRQPPPYLTALAYYTTEQSPSFRLHPRVMPVLTSDRAQWHDPKYRAEDKALIQRWANSGAERIATWDYYFGAPYPYPRQFTEWMIESIRFLNESGVDVFFSQLPSVWGLDGPKAWLAAELLRDPRQDADALLDEYYDNFFGAAAEPIREFYEIAEQTRNDRAGPANWIKYYKDEAGIELFEEATLLQMRASLNKAETLLSANHSDDRASASGVPAGKCRFIQRVTVVSEAFSYTESYAAYHSSRIRLVELSMRVLRSDPDEIDADGLLVAFSDYQNAKAAFRTLSTELAQKPMHRGLSAFNRLKQTEPLPLVFAALAHAGYGSGKLDLPLEASLLETLSAWQKGKYRFARFGKNPRLEHSGEELRNFLGPKIPMVDAWRIQYRASEGLRIATADGDQHSGLRIENSDIVSLEQTFPVISDKSYLVEIDAGWRVSPDNRSWIQLNWKSISGEKLGTDVLLRLPNGASEGTQLLRFAFTAPANAYDLKLGIVTNRQYQGDYLEIKRVDFGLLVSDE